MSGLRPTSATRAGWRSSWSRTRAPSIGEPHEHPHHQTRQGLPSWQRRQGGQVHGAPRCVPATTGQGLQARARRQEGTTPVTDTSTVPKPARVLDKLMGALNEVVTAGLLKPYAPDKEAY